LAPLKRQKRIFYDNCILPIGDLSPDCCPKRKRTCVFPDCGRFGPGEAADPSAVARNERTGFAGKSAIVIFGFGPPSVRVAALFILTVRPYRFFMTPMGWFRRRMVPTKDTVSEGDCFTVDNTWKHVSVSIAGFLTRRSPMNASRREMSNESSSVRGENTACRLSLLTKRPRARAAHLSNAAV